MLLVINPLSQNVDNSDFRSNGEHVQSNNSDACSDIDSDYTHSDVDGSDCEDVYSDFGNAKHRACILYV